jgi:ribosomal-protein-serine acetyltransferase
MRGFDLGDDTILRPFELKDAKAIYSTVIANYDHLRRFMHWVVPDFSLRSAKDFIRRSRASTADGSAANFGIFVEGVLAGTIGIIRTDKNSKKAELGYWITAKYEGCGLITSSCRTLINYGFGEMGLHRLEIHCSVENARSRAIPERLGFTFEGTLRESQWRHDRFYDMAIYGILENEWKAFTDL